MNNNRKINVNELEWESAAHENLTDPGVWKKMIVRREDVDLRSKLRMINLSKVPVGRTYAEHSHETMHEIFYS